MRDGFKSKDIKKLCMVSWPWTCSQGAIVFSHCQYQKRAMKLPRMPPTVT